MKNIKLLNLSLTNFKGIKEFELDANGENVNIYGENATGKTTIADAFIWLLFDKDSQNKKDFDLKTLKDGKPIHNLNHEVEATLSIDGKELSLKKSFSEKWTKKRGSVNQEFTGHTTNYYIDSVPSKKKEFTDKVASIVDEDIFKLLTSTGYFNEQLHWKKRRDLLLELAGDVTEGEVIAENKDLEQLAEALNGRSIEDHKKVIAEKRKEINEELDRIPIRIDEINRGLPDVNGMDKAKIEGQIKRVSKDIESKQSQINDIRNGSEVNNVRKQISDIDLQISNVKNEHEQQGQQEVFGLKTKLQEEQSNVGILRTQMDQKDQQCQTNKTIIADLKANMDEWRKHWQEVNSREFTHESDCNCPTCGQELPTDQIEQAREKALKQFNTDKSNELEKYKNKGLEAKEKVESKQAENEKLASEIQKLNSDIESKQQRISKLENDIQTAESNVKPITEDETYNKLMSDRQALEQQIEQLEQSSEQSVQEVQQEIQSLKERQNTLQMDQSKLEQSEQSLKRIEELEQQEKDLAYQFEQTEQELYLADEFIRTKVNLLEEKINSKFQYARFNLFKTNINGGLEEICETTYEGVPYSSGLNNAARINVGLDVINTLSSHYGVQAPIFVDNAESVTSLIDIDAQIISLVVSESDKQLRIENKVQKGVA